MKYKKHLFLLLLLSSITTSCGLMITQRIFFGVKKPKVQTTNNIQNFIRKNNGVESTFSLDKESFLLRISNSSKYFAKWELYNVDGYSIIPLDSNINHCNSNTYSFFNNFQHKNYYIDSTVNINTDTVLVNGLKLLNGEGLEFQAIEKADYLLVIYWASFMGKYSSDLFELERVATNNALVNINTIKINMDFKKHYEITNDKLKIEQKVKRK